MEIYGEAVGAWSPGDRRCGGYSDVTISDAMQKKQC